MSRVKAKGLHLAFVYHTPFWRHGNAISTVYPPIGRYVDALSPYFSKITLVVPRRSEIDQPLYTLKASNIDLVELRPHANIQQFWLHALSFYLAFFRLMPKWDLINIRMPTLMGFPAYLAAHFYKKPVFLVVVGESLPYTRLAGYPHLKQLLASTEAWIQDFLMRLMVSNSLTFTNGHDLLAKLSRPGCCVKLMRSSTISRFDLIPPPYSIRMNSPCRIITVATIAPRKGTSCIPRIISHLNKGGIFVRWSYIGEVDGQAGEQELRKTHDLACRLGVSSQISFHPKMDWEMLRSHYRANDLFVLPTFMEGIPRVILEAQASGLPVITTTVGGIPQAIHDGVDGLLVDPNDPAGMARAIIRVIQDTDLQHRMITNGIEAAERFTLEAETERMLQAVNENLLDVRDPYAIA
jgi:glycosyltransferase involved in cell wall biosynthesis